MNITSWYVAANDADTAQRLAWHARIYGEWFDAIGHRAEGYVATHPDDIPHAARARFTHAFTVIIDARGLPVRTTVHHTGTAPGPVGAGLDAPSLRPIPDEAARVNPRTFTVDDTATEHAGRLNVREDIG